MLAVILMINDDNVGDDDNDDDDNDDDDDDLRFGDPFWVNPPCFTMALQPYQLGQQEQGRRRRQQEDQCYVCVTAVVDLLRHSWWSDAVSTTATCGVAVLDKQCRGFPLASVRETIRNVYYSLSSFERAVRFLSGLVCSFISFFLPFLR